MRVSFSFEPSINKICKTAWNRLKLNILCLWWYLVSYSNQIITFFTRISRAKMLFLAFDRLIPDYTSIKSLVISCIHNLLQNIFDSSPTPRFWLNRLRNFIIINFLNGSELTFVRQLNTYNLMVNFIIFAIAFVLNWFI